VNRTFGVSAAATLTAACAVLVGIGIVSSEQPQKLDAKHYVEDVTLAREETVQRVGGDVSSPRDWLPSRLHTGPDGERFSLSDRVIRGHVIDVRPGHGFLTTDQDGAQTVQVSFSDDRAHWMTVHIDVEVRETIAGASSPSIQTIGLAITPQVNFEAYKDGLMQVTDAVWFLDNSSSVFAYDPSVAALTWDGAGMLPVDGGRLSAPAFGPEEAQFLAGVETVDDLASAAVPQR
jgi:hypothetical protein